MPTRRRTLTGLIAAALLALAAALAGTAPGGQVMAPTIVIQEH